MLPFAKGKGIDILLLDKKYVLKNAIFNVDYLFPIYFSSFYLALFYLHYLRNKLAKIKNFKLNLSKNNLMVIGVFLLFVASTVLNSANHIFSVPIFLSSLQLLVLLSIFLIPFFLVSQRQKWKDFSQIVASSTLFQSVWLILQTINRGYLGRDIEVHLPGFEYGNQSTENFDLLRLTGTFFESSILGTFLLTNLAFLIFMLASNKIESDKEKKVLYLTIALGSISIVLTGSRAIYLVTAILWGIIAYFKGWWSKRGLRLGIDFVKNHKIIIPLLIGGVIFVTPYLVNRLGSIDHMFSKYGSGTYRLELSRLSLRLTSVVPWLGVGLNMSPYYLATSFPQEDYFVNSAHPHNLLIQLLAETGVVGFSLFIIFLYLIARPLILKKAPFNEFALAALIYFILAQIYPIFINQMEIISFFFIYLGFAANHNQNHSDPHA